MTRKQIVDTMNAVRGFLLQTIEGLDENQFLRVPKGFRNNILWNLGHIVCVQCELVYKPSGKSLPLPDWYHEKFYDGTSPEGWDTKPSIEDIVGRVKTMNDTVIGDLQQGVFRTFRPFELLPGFSLEDPEQALNFHTVHEGIHLGTVMALRKLVSGA